MHKISYLQADINVKTLSDWLIIKAKFKTTNV